MKRLFLFVLFAMLAVPQSAHADVIIAGWDTWSSATAPAVSATAMDITASATASASTGAWSITDSPAGRGSSEDTTWGTFDGNGVAASAVTNVANANFTVTNGRPSAEVTFTVTNNGATDMVLNQFHMDVVAFRPNAPRAYALNVLAGSDITVGNVFTSADDEITNLGGGLTGNDLHDDIDLSLAGLADNTLAAGESATIQIAFSSGTGSGGGHHLFLDNVAISGDFAVVPEPTSMVALGLTSLAMFVRRRRRFA